MLVVREAVLRAGGRQLSRALSGLHSADGSPGRSCGSAGVAQTTSSNTASPGPLVVSSDPRTTMANTEGAFPMLEKVRSPLVQCVLLLKLLKYINGNGNFSQMI